MLVNGNVHSSTSELVIPEGVKNISASAVRYFKNVTKIKLPSTVTEIAENNFQDCKYLKEVTLPSTVTTVGKKAFYGCTGLQTVTLNNKGSIGYSAFSGCTALTRVNIGSGVTGFVYAVYSSEYPFYNCPKLSEINISDFASFNAIQYLYFLTNGDCGTAEEKNLYVNGNLHNWQDNFYIPEGVKTYNNAALRYFTNVNKVSLPSTMTTVSGFSNHSALTEITLSSKVDSVAKDAFANCEYLSRIICKATIVPSTGGSIATNPSEIKLKVPTGCRSKYSTAVVWKEFNIEEAKTEIFNEEMYAGESLYINYSGLFAKNIVWSHSNASIAKINTSVNSRWITASDFAYNGTTNIPYKKATVTATFEDGDKWQFNVTVYPSEVILTDGNAYKLANDFKAKKVSYTRTYAEKYKNHLQCFYVPFDVEVTDELLEGYTFYKLYMVSQKDENGNGEIEPDEPLKMILNRVSAGQVLKANMPYYIKPKDVTTLTVTAENTTLHAAANGSVSCSTTENEYTLVGINESTNIKGLYTMSAKGNLSTYTKDTYLGSFRWYMSVRDRMGSGAELENYARPIEIVIEGEEEATEETTGVAALDDNASAPKHNKVFTLDGRQVNDVDNLPRGMYIINGKKVVKK